jgi:phosphoribosylformimino-5-aminoimidazole carboxamide ribonucleotide (ProFAR) isomerase
VAGVEDIRRLMAARAGISGCILGRAIYDGDLSAEEALAAAS